MNELGFKFKHLEMYKDIALRVAEESYCTRLQVGAVVVTKSLGIYTGYNGTVSGLENVCECNETGKTLPTVIHAEQNAFDKMLKEGVSADGCTLIVTHSPCFECSKRIIQAGIKTVVYINCYKNLDETLKFLRDSGVNVFKYSDLI